MTENELTLIRTTAKVMVLEVVMVDVLRIEAQSSPSLAAFLNEVGTHLEGAAKRMRFANLSAEMSDLLASVFQESVNEFLKQLKQSPPPNA